MPLLNGNLFPDLNQTEFFYQYLVAMTVNVAWRLQRVWIMSYPMTQAEFDDNYVVAGDDDSRLKFYYNGKGHYFQS